jgi:endonuclease/exonuclease/phosphatase family metal-dependent hydrolase
MKKIIKRFVALILLVLLIPVGLIGYMTIVDYEPELQLELEIINSSENEFSKELTIMTWNLGFAGLGADSDFFMDGGTDVNPSLDQFETNFEGIKSTLESYNLDAYFIQEIDRDSNRTHYIDMYEIITNELFAEYNATFATNYIVPYVFIPWPPIGKVHSGIATFTNAEITSSTRVGFDINYSWPTKILHLDRCLIVTRHPVKGSSNELVLINLHLSAYDDGGLRAEQLKVLKEIMTAEYQAGNYVIAGGDFNQQFPSIDNSKYPVLYPDNYTPNTIDNGYLESDWQYAVSDEYPTYRLLNEVYNESTSQIGVIDGFIVSPNVEVILVENLNLEFEYSDHNPVVASFKLK